MNTDPISLQPARAEEAEALAALRVEAMRESLENVGRFDPARARERFLSSFSPAHTRHVVHGGQRVGVVVVRPEAGSMVLDHLYLHPSSHGRGIGSAVVRLLQAEAAASSRALHVGALKHSRSNRFYLRHGFRPLAEGDWDNYYVWHAGGTS